MSGASNLLGAETNGVAFSASDNSMEIRDTTTPANNYIGSLPAKIGSVGRTVGAMQYGASQLLEWGPENLELWSEDFSNVSWQKTDTTVTANAETAPDGNVTADKLTQGVATNATVDTNAAKSIVVGTTVTASRHIKRDNCDWVVVAVIGAANSVNAWFNVATGAVGAHTQVGVGVFINKTIEPAANGFYRCSVTGTVGASVNTASRSFCVSSDGSTTRLANGSRFEWGGQIQRAAAPSSYRPTTTVGSYGLRRDYDPRLNGKAGFLREEARINIVLWNRDLTNAAWVKTNTTAVKNQTGPDGIANAASSLTATAANGTCVQTIAIASTTRWQSAFVKRITGSGVVEMTMDNVTWTPITVTASWAPVEIPGQTPPNPVLVGFRIATSGDAIAVDLVQNEIGAFRTSPIITTTAAVTRGADVASLPIAQMPVGLSANTLYARLMAKTLNQQAVAFGFNSTAANESFFIGKADATNATAGNNWLATLNDASPVLRAMAATANDGLIHEIATAYDNTTMSASLDGTAVVTAANTQTPTPTKLNFGGREDGQHFNGWVLDGMALPLHKSDAQLVVMATPSEGAPKLVGGQLLKSPLLHGRLLG